jgi:hypothetical protein
MAIRRLLTALLWCSAYGAAQNQPPSLTTIYNFTSDLGYPFTALTMGEGGVLYGVTRSPSTVFSLTPPASPGGSWTYSVLYNFQGSSSPIAGLTIGPGGVFYGASGNASGSGAIYSLTPPASPGGQWTFAIIASFEGYLPSRVAISSAGVLFGTDIGLTSAAFALVPPASSSGSWTEETITTYFGVFQFPTGGLAIGGGGVLYVSTFSDENIWADLQELAPPATPGGAWKQTVLYHFTGFYSGLATDVVIGSGGVLYGTVYAQLGGGGSIYSLTPPLSPGGAWTEATLLEFPTPKSGDGPTPGPLTLGENDTLYGTTQSGGASFAGTAYALKPPATPGGAWTEIPLHTFTGSDGMSPTGLVIGTGGVLYGTTTQGGAYGYGPVFAITE